MRALTPAIHHFE